MSGNNSQSARDIASRAELERLIKDRRNDPPVPQYGHPKPGWMVDAEHAERRRMAMRERRINYLERRLYSASQDMRQAYDRSR